MKPEPFIQIFILSRNRFEYLRESLDSCLAIDYKNYEIIVSENSTNNITRDYLSNHHAKNRFTVRARENLSYMEHTNQILSEVKADYFMMFHDDDVLLPSCLKTYMNIMLADDQLSAVGGNSMVIEKTTKTSRKIMHRSMDCKITSVHDLFKNYFARSHAHPAFPTYLYRTSKVAMNRLAFRKGGVYSDSAFMYENLKNGAIYFSAKTVAMYRVHGANISSVIHVKHLCSLTNYLMHLEPSEKTLLMHYKYLHWLKYFVTRPSKQIGFRDKAFLNHLIRYYTVHPYFIIYVLYTKFMSQLKKRL